MAEAFFIFVLTLALWLLWITGKKARRRRHINYLIKTQGREAAWKWRLAQPDWRKLRIKCAEAFGWRCAGCNKPLSMNGPDYPEAHHRRYDNLGFEKVIRDLICFCHDCHMKMPRSAGLYKG